MYGREKLRFKPFSLSRSEYRRPHIVRVGRFPLRGANIFDGSGLSLRQSITISSTLFMKTTLALLAALTFTATLQAADAKPLKILLITGGCCHDYAKQKDILKTGIESRINAEVTQVHTDDKSTKPPLAALGPAQGGVWP